MARQTNRQTTRQTRRTISGMVIRVRMIAGEHLITIQDSEDNWYDMTVPANIEEIAYQAGWRASAGAWELWIWEREITLTASVAYDWDRDGHTCYRCQRATDVVIGRRVLHSRRDSSPAHVLRFNGPISAANLTNGQGHCPRAVWILLAGIGEGRIALDPEALMADAERHGVSYASVIPRR